jgi:hypothetical protein
LPGLNATGHRVNIPKVFHLIWLSSRQLPDGVKRNVDSWQHHNTDFQLKHWALEDVDLSDSMFARQALAHRKWAFVTDYLRLKILHDEGGIYLDSDVIVKGSFAAHLHHECFISWEFSYLLGPHVIGGAPGNQVIGDWLNFLKDRSFDRGDGTLDCTPLPNVITRYSALSHGLQLDGARQTAARTLDVYPANVFTLDMGDGRCVAEHLYAGSWLSHATGSFQADVEQHQRSLPKGIFRNQDGWKIRIQNAQRHARNVKLLFPQNFRKGRIDTPLMRLLLPKALRVQLSAKSALKRARIHEEVPDCLDFFRPQTADKPLA